jgi:hypothetical protein
MLPHFAHSLIFLNTKLGGNTYGSVILWRSIRGIILNR